MIKNAQEIVKAKIDKGLMTHKNFFSLGEGQTPACLNVLFNNDGSFGKRLGSSTMNTIALESTAGYGMYDFGVLGVGGNDGNTKLLLHFDGTPIVDSSPKNYSITTYGDIVVSSLKSKFGGASGLFASNPEIDYMEYANDGAAQAAYVSSDTTVTESLYVESNQTSAFTTFGDSGGTEYRVAQSFSLDTSYLLTSVQIYCASKNGTPSQTVTVRIETNNSNAPSGGLADANLTKQITTFNNGQWNVFTFATPATISSGKYWIVLSIADGAVDDRWIIAGGTDTYANEAYSSHYDGVWHTDGSGREIGFKLYKGVTNLQSYSESTIKTQGSYSLKGLAQANLTLTDTLIKTFSTTLDLREQDNISLSLYSSRTGTNIKLGFRNTGATLGIAETIPYITTINTWQNINWDISGVVANSKNNVDQLIFTIMEDSAANTFYIDNVTSGIYKVINKSSFLTAPYSSDWTTPGGLGNFSLDNQLNFNYVGTSQVLIGQGSNSTNYWHLIYNTAATNTVNGLYFQAYSGGTLVINMSGAYTPNTGSFTHYELVRNSTNNIYLFVAGSNIFGTGTTSGVMPGSGSLLKFGVNVVTTNNSYLHAFADEWRFSNNARHVTSFTSPTVAYNSDIIQERRLLCSSGTGIYYSTDIGKTWAIIQTSRAAATNYFGFVKDYVINTNENYEPPQYWAGTATQYFSNISTAAPAAKHSASHQGFCIFLNESANKTSMYYVDQNSMFTSAFSNFKLPTDRNDELTGGFTIGRSFYVSSKYKIFRLNYIGGNPDWEYVEVRNWGFVPKTVKKVNLPGMGEAIIGLDWTKKVRIFFGSDDEIISDHIAENNGITPFYLNNISALNLNQCWAEDDKKAQVYRLFLVYGNSSTVSYSLCFNYRSGSWYPENNRPYQSGILASDTANNLYMMGCNYNGRVVTMDSGNTETGSAIDDYYITPYFYQQSPVRVHKSQQINMFFDVTSSGTIYLEDRSQFDNFWNLKAEMTLASAISSLQIRHTIDLPESMNVHQFKLSSSANTAEPWRCNLMDLTLNDIGIGKE